MINVLDESGINKDIINTLNKIYDTYEEYPDKTIYVYKDFIYNSQVLKELNDLDIHVIDNLDILNKEDILIINQYGVSKSIYNYLDENNIKYIDTTSEYFNNLQKEMLNKVNEGYEIILYIDNFILKQNILNWDILFTDSYNENDKDKYIFYDNIKDEDIINKIKKECHNKLEIIKYNNFNYQYSINDINIIIKQKDEIFNIDNSINIDSYDEINKYIFNNDLNNKNILLIGSPNTTLKEIYNYKYYLTFMLFYKDRYNKLKNNQDNFNKLLYTDNESDLVKEIISYIDNLNKDGKYLRGVLISLGEYFSNKDSNSYIDLAYIYELFQTSVLIHDDIIDNAKIRRCKNTIPHEICEKYLNNKNNAKYHKDTLALANSLGICAGDLGFYLANKLFIDKYHKHKEFINLFKLYNDIIIKTIKGEIIDVYLPFLDKYQYISVSDDDIINIYHLKTSWYTIIGPFTLGHTLGGTLVNPYEDILNKIGIMFQIKDDLFGIFSNIKEAGKDNYLDIKEYKETIIYSYIITTPYKDEFLKIYGKDNLNINDIKKIKYLIKVSGTLDYVLDYLKMLENDVIIEVDKLNLLEEEKDILKGLVIYIKERER